MKLQHYHQVEKWPIFPISPEPSVGCLQTQRSITIQFLSGKVQQWQGLNIFAVDSIIFNGHQKEGPDSCNYICAEVRFMNSWAPFCLKHSWNASTGVLLPVDLCFETVTWKSSAHLFYLQCPAELFGHREEQRWCHESLEEKIIYSCLRDSKDIGKSTLGVNLQLRLGEGLVLHY